MKHHPDGRCGVLRWRGVPRLTWSDPGPDCRTNNGWAHRPMGERVMRSNGITRRHLAAAGGFAAATILHWPANAAEFTYKYASALPYDHPMTIRVLEAVAKIKAATNGRLEILCYPNNVLGGDTAMIAQAISGAVQMYSVAPDLLAPRDPGAGIMGVGFAFPDYPHAWAAVDGAVGDYFRAVAEKVGLHCLPKAFDHGFRHITSRSKPIVTPEDLHGFKIRLPVTPTAIALFRHLGAAPTPMNFNEVYTSLQTRRGRRPGEPAAADRRDQALRGAEGPESDEPLVGGRFIAVSTSRRGTGCRRRFRTRSARS